MMKTIPIKPSSWLATMRYFEFSTQSLYFRYLLLRAIAPAVGDEKVNVTRIARKRETIILIGRHIGRKAF